MKRSTHTHRKLVKRIALGLAVDAVAVPAAQAQTYSTGPAANGSVSVAQPAIPTDGPRAGGVPETLLRISTDGPRSGPSAAQLREVIAETYTTDAPRSGPATVDLPQAAPLTGPSGFDWLDAGIGIAIGIAASLGLVAIVLLVARRRERVPAY